MPAGPAELERRYISGDIKTGNILDVVNSIVDQEERESFARKNKPLIVMTDINEQLKKLNAGIHLLNSLTDSLIRMQSRIIQLEESKISEFQTYYFNIPLVSTTKLVHLDLIKGGRGNEGSKNVPTTATTIVEYPMKPVRQVRILARGSGNLKYAINVDGRTSSKADVELNTNENHLWSDQAGFPSIRNINIVINGTTAVDAEIVCIT